MVPSRTTASAKHSAALPQKRATFARAVRTSIPTTDWGSVPWNGDHGRSAVSKACRTGNDEALNRVSAGEGLRTEFR
jgi:hypothetical protein